VRWRVAILVLDPRTGALLASSDDTPGQPIVPASTLKALVVAMALDADLITTEQRFDCGNGSRSYDSQLLRDAGSYGSLGAAEILAASSNVSLSRIFDLIGGERCPTSSSKPRCPEWTLPMRALPLGES
jgi:cell division protein FtsI/penicillin-binding protein 2